MSLVELIAQADDRSLAAGGLACLDRCLPLLGETDDEALRPLWSSLEAGGAGWADELTRLRESYAGVDGDDEGAQLVRAMLAAAPGEFPSGGLRAWAEACSSAALQVHRLLDATDDDGPLTAGELRRQTHILDLLTTASGGLRQALVVSTEGRRVVRAVVSRRARVQG
ncbi:hypothetical protein [Streptomyces sp. Da 82-17]|uniref:hypothetical protein n=1 Tax=Streptomyces sp. Da 82-17 TaxID=3377116 RepID=UPI0038D49F23